MKPILLASSSIYRRQLLSKLGLDFDFAKPNQDETPLPNEKPNDLVLRLAEAKARSLASEFPNHLIIGSDQVASFSGDIIGKPGNFENAKKQLMSFQGQSVTFYTGLCLLNAESQHCQSYLETDIVSFRDLSETAINNYLAREQPFDCAGSFKSEGLGISLFSKIQSRDPNSLIGLPLIGLIDLLQQEGVHPLAQDSGRLL